MSFSAALMAPRWRDRRQTGFTLLEILVVVSLIALLSLAVLVVPVWTDDARELDSQAARLSDTLTTLSEDSLFSGKLMALRITDSGWTPVQYNVAERRFVPAEGEGLQAQRLPDNLELTWQSDQLGGQDDQGGQTVTLKQAAQRLVAQDPFGGGHGLLADDKERNSNAGRDKGRLDGPEPLPQVYFFPSGESTPITFTVRSINNLDLQAKRQLTALGQVRDPVHDKKETIHTAADKKPIEDRDDDSLIGDDFLKGGNR